jgi:hypothetical protein
MAQMRKDDEEIASLMRSKYMEILIGRTLNLFASKDLEIEKFQMAL